MRCIRAIWPAGPPKPMQPILNQTRSASPNGTAGTGSVSGGFVFSRSAPPLAPAHGYPEDDGNGKQSQRDAGPQPRRLVGQPDGVTAGGNRDRPVAAVRAQERRRLAV